MEGKQTDTDYGRLYLILDREGLVHSNGNLKQKMLSGLSYRDPETGREVFVFHDGGDAGAIENVTRNNTRDDRTEGLNEKTKTRLALWLSETKGYVHQSDLFDRSFASDEAFLTFATLARPNRHRPIVYRSKTHEDIDTCSRVLDTMFQAHSGYAFDKPHVAQFVIPAARGLTAAVKKSRSVGDYLDSACKVFVGYRPCPGCGCGAAGFQHLLPLTDILFEREQDIVAELSTPDRKLAFAYVLERKLSWLRMQGQPRQKEAKKVAESLAKIVFDDLWDHKDKRAVLALGKQSKSVLHGSPAFGQLKDAVAEWFGEHSSDAVGFHRCLACKRISECADGKAKDFLDTAREVQEKALEHAKRKGDWEMEAEHRDTGINLDFLEAAWLEGQCGPDTERLHTRLTEEFCKKKPRRLMDMLEYYDGSPLRRARVHYWLWAHQEVKTANHLWAAQRCLRQNPTVQELCVLDVPKFKRQLRAALKPFAREYKEAS